MQSLLMPAGLHYITSEQTVPVSPTLVGTPAHVSSRPRLWGPEIEFRFRFCCTAALHCTSSLKLCSFGGVLGGVGRRGGDRRGNSSWQIL